MATAATTAFSLWVRLGMARVNWYPMIAESLNAVLTMRKLLGRVNSGDVHCLHSADGSLCNLDVTSVAQLIHNTIKCPRCGSAVKMKAYLAPPGGGTADILRPQMAFYACIPPANGVVDPAALLASARCITEGETTMTLDALMAFTCNRVVLCVEVLCTNTTTRKPSKPGGKPQTRRCVPSFVYFDVSGNVAIVEKSRLKAWGGFWVVLGKASRVGVGTAGRRYKLSYKTRVAHGAGRIATLKDIALAPMAGKPLGGSAVKPPKLPPRREMNGVGKRPSSTAPSAHSTGSGDSDSDADSEPETPPRPRGMVLHVDTEEECTTLFRRNKRVRRPVDDEDGVLMGSALKTRVRKAGNGTVVPPITAPS